MPCIGGPAPATGTPAHTVYPYLLRDLTFTRSNHVWVADITYIPMTHGFVYVFAVLDWASRRALAWQLSNTLVTDFCLKTVQEALARYGTPDIFNTDQGCQFFGTPHGVYVDNLPSRLIAA